MFFIKFFIKNDSEFFYRIDFTIKMFLSILIMRFLFVSLRIIRQNLSFIFSYDYVIFFIYNYVCSTR